MELERSSIDDQCGSNAEVTCLSKELDIIKVLCKGVVSFTVLSDDTIAVLSKDQLELYKTKKADGQDACQFEKVSAIGVSVEATALTNIGSSKLVVLHDGVDKLYTLYPYYRCSLVTVFSIENDIILRCLEMKTDVKNSDQFKNRALAYDNEKLAILMTIPLKLELLNMTTCLSESVNMNSFTTDMFPVGYGQPFMSMRNTGGQTHVYISIDAGGGMRKLTKIDTNGHILATFVEINEVKPGPIAAVGDGTLVFSYDRKLLLLSENLKILANLKTDIDVIDMKIHQTKKGRHLYCLTLNTITQYSLQ